MWSQAYCKIAKSFPEHAASINVRKVSQCISCADLLLWVFDTKAESLQLDLLGAEELQRSATQIMLELQPVYQMFKVGAPPAADLLLRGLYI